MRLRKRRGWPAPVREPPPSNAHDATAGGSRRPWISGARPKRGGNTVAVAPRQTQYGRRKPQRPATSAAAAAATTSACVRDGSSFHSTSQRTETQGAPKTRLMRLR